MKQFYISRDLLSQSQESNRRQITRGRNSRRVCVCVYVCVCCWENLQFHRSYPADCHDVSMSSMPPVSPYYTHTHPLTITASVLQRSQWIIILHYCIITL